mmetsp:Transcript_45544/g.75925  ORF Transcript_45544/g.75925 Transcript_45544/m.75925 type:complete len:229 (+) Transcript_45544:1171-1857(+)
MYLLDFSRARYTLPNFPRPSGLPMSKSAKFQRFCFDPPSAVAPLTHLLLSFCASESAASPCEDASTPSLLSHSIGVPVSAAPALVVFACAPVTPPLAVAFALSASVALPMPAHTFILLAPDFNGTRCAPPCEARGRNPPFSPSILFWLVSIWVAEAAPNFLEVALDTASGSWFSLLLKCTDICPQGSGAIVFLCIYVVEIFFVLPLVTMPRDGTNDASHGVRFKLTSR